MVTTTYINFSFEEENFKLDLVLENCINIEEEALVDINNRLSTITLKKLKESEIRVEGIKIWQ